MRVVFVFVVLCVVGTPANDDLKCLNHYLKDFIKHEAATRVQELLDEYRGKTLRFNEKIRRQFEQAEVAVQHCFEHINERVDSEMAVVARLMENESLRHFLSNKFIAVVMEIFADDELRQACRELGKAKEVRENEDARHLMGILADRMETIGSQGAQNILEECGI